MNRDTGNAIAPSAAGPLKLQMELVPKPLFGRNLRSTEALGKYRWQKLRRELVKTHGMRCAICGATGKCYGHEVWDYREKEKVGTAVLLRIEMVCMDCHDIHHWGRIVVLLAQGAITAERYYHLKKHFRRVNGCRREVFDNHFREARQQWEKRSKKRWKIDWGDYATAVAEAKGARDA